jgi:hypothetical protein
MKRKQPVRSSGAHARTDDLFDKWIASVDGDPSAAAILRGLHWVCNVTEENGFGMQQMGEELHSRLGELIDKMDELIGEVADANPTRKRRK